jgi:hypothetical protein
MQKLIHHISVGYIALLVLVKMLAMPLACLQYDLNKEYIATNLCENKDKPAMHCSGKCHLKKQLTHANDTGNPQNQKTTSQSVGVDYFEEIFPISFSCRNEITIDFKSYKNLSLPVGFHGNIFHPPI